MSSRLIVGNWKMNGTLAEAEALCRALTQFTAEKAPKLKKSDVGIVICPPAHLWFKVKEWLAGSEVALGAQDCHAAEKGAYTGDISASMLKEAGGSFAIVGHSERRSNHWEDNITVSAKAKAALKTGITPIICVGETLAEREEGRAATLVSTQIEASIPQDAEPGSCWVAYEPVWAIGSGLTPNMDEIEEMHKTLVEMLMHRREWPHEQVGVLYGGSVKPGNAAEILQLPSVSGVLVGGASLNAKDFCNIIEAAL